MKIKQNKKIIPYSRQFIDREDIGSIKQILKSQFLTQGPQVEKFENNLKKISGSKYAVAANSATSCLILACLALGIKKNDLVWTSSNTFVSTANSAVHCGAIIDLIDIDLETGNISINALKKKLLYAKKINNLPKVVITVHFGGQPTDQEEIWKLSKKYKFKIIEDASHSIGAKHKGEKVGSCRWSELTIMSFHPVKPITSGEGGVALTNKKKYAYKMQLLRTHGIEKNLNTKITNQFGNWYYEQRLLGFNFRLSDIHAALGISQLKKLKYFNSKRKQIVKRYNLIFEGNKNIIPLKINKENFSSHHLYVIRIVSKKKNIRNNLIKFLKTKKVTLNVHYIPVHYHPYYKKFKIDKNSLKNSEKYFHQALSLPLYVGLKKKDQINVAKHIENFINNYK